MEVDLSRNFSAMASVETNCICKTIAPTNRTLAVPTMAGVDDDKIHSINPHNDIIISKNYKLSLAPSPAVDSALTGRIYVVAGARVTLV